MESTSTENEKTDNFAASSAATKRNTPAHQRVTDTNIFDSAQMDPLVAVWILILLLETIDRDLFLFL